MKSNVVLLLIVALVHLLSIDGAPLEIRRSARHKRQINFIQRQIINMLDPKPIVDTMTEDEKYGNEVDHPVGKSVVNAIERFSNAVNSVWNVPVETAKQMSRGMSEVLNNLGARIVGLQK